MRVRRLPRLGGAAQQVVQPQGRAAQTLRTAAKASGSRPLGMPRTTGYRSRRITAAPPPRTRAATDVRRQVLGSGRRVGRIGHGLVGGAPERDLPPVGQELGDTALRMVLNPDQHIGEVADGIDSVFLTGRDQRVQHGESLSSHLRDRAFTTSLYCASVVFTRLCSVRAEAPARHRW